MFTIPFWIKICISVKILNERKTHITNKVFNEKEKFVIKRNFQENEIRQVKSSVKGLVNERNCGQ